MGSPPTPEPETEIAPAVLTLPPTLRPLPAPHTHLLPTPDSFRHKTTEEQRSRAGGSDRSQGDRGDSVNYLKQVRSK